MKISPYHILYPPHRRNSIGNVYIINRISFVGVYILAYGGHDDYGDPYVHMIDLGSGSQWTAPMRVTNLHDLTDSEMQMILDPDYRGVEYANLGPFTDKWPDLFKIKIGDAVVQRTIQSWVRKKHDKLQVEVLHENIPTPHSLSTPSS